jgi:hypothetical protein
MALLLIYINRFVGSRANITNGEGWVAPVANPFAEHDFQTMATAE